MAIPITSTLPENVTAPIATSHVQPVVYQLRDIHGFDPVPWWPPAIGWWLLVGAIIFGLWAIRHWLPRIPGNISDNLAWRWDAARQLRALRRRVRRQDVQISTQELSELLRRIAMARHGREACAGLTGIAWLEWLKTNDPVDYDWLERGRLLLAMPYAPPGLFPSNITHLLELIDATSKWLGRTKPKPSQLEQVNV